MELLFSKVKVTSPLSRRLFGHLLLPRPRLSFPLLSLSLSRPGKVTLCREKKKRVRKHGKGVGIKGGSLPFLLVLFCCPPENRAKAEAKPN